MPVVFIARFYMVDKYFRREENRTELALHRLRMLKHSLEDLNVIDLLTQLLVFSFNFGYGV